MANHLSYSSISMYLDCGRRWQGHYKQDLKSPEGEALVFGTIGHNVMEAFVRDHSVDMIEVFEHQWNKLVTPEAVKKIVWKDTPEATKAAGYRLFELPELFDILSGINPRYIDETPMLERFIKWQLPNVPDIIGYIDCIGEDGVPYDFKTASAMWPDGKAEKEMQPLFYLAALEQLGEHDHNWTFRHLVVTKAKNPRVSLFESVRSPVEIETLEHIVRMAWRGISEGLFLPNPSSWLCDPQFCGAYSVCIGKR